MIFETRIAGENWTRASACFQIWARQFNLSEEQSLAYILAGQKRFYEYGTTQRDIDAATKVLRHLMPKNLMFVKDQVITTLPTGRMEFGDYFPGQEDGEDVYNYWVEFEGGQVVYMRQPDIIEMFGDLELGLPNFPNRKI